MAAIGYSKKKKESPRIRANLPFCLLKANAYILLMNFSFVCLINLKIKLQPVDKRNKYAGCGSTTHYIMAPCSIISEKKCTPL